MFGKGKVGRSLPPLPGTNTLEANGVKDTQRVDNRNLIIGTSIIIAIWAIRPKVLHVAVDVCIFLVWKSPFGWVQFIYRCVGN